MGRGRRGAPLQPFQVSGTSAATTAARAPPTVALDKAIRARGRPGVSRTGVSDLTSKRNYPGSGECRKGQLGMSLAGHRRACPGQRWGHFSGHSPGRRPCGL